MYPAARHMPTAASNVSQAALGVRMAKTRADAVITRPPAVSSKAMLDFFRTRFPPHQGPSTARSNSKKISLDATETAAPNGDLSLRDVARHRRLSPST